MFAASKSGSADAKAPQFNYVTMLLHGDGTNGAQNNTFVDSSTNNFTITRNGNTTQGTFSPYGSNWSNYFNGSSGVTVSSTSSQFGFSGDFTWEAWINLASLPSSGGNYSIICSRGASASNSAFQFLIGNSSGTYQITGTISISSSDSNLVWNISSAPSIGTWYHVAIVRSGSSVQAYWNGTAIGSAQTASGTTNTPTVNPSIGFRGGAYNDLFFNGYISNFRMVGSAVYTSNFTPSITPLTAISGTRILTCADNRFIDDSTNAFTITAYSSPSVQRFSPFSPTTAYSTSVIGGSGYFDGSGDYLTIPSSSTFSFTGDFTWEAWVYLPATISGCEIVSKHLSGVTGWYMLSINSSLNLSFVIWNSVNTSSSATSSGSLVVGAWNHVAGGRNGSTVFCCLNGAYTSAALSVTPRTTNNAVNIGMNLDGSSSAIKGYISNLRCVTSAVYTANYTVPTAPLTAITNTQLLLSTTNAGILDNAMMNDLETVGNAQISTSIKKYGTGSIYMDGTSDSLFMRYTPDFYLQGSYTIEAWIYPLTVSGWHPIFTIQPTSASSFGTLSVNQSGTTIVAEDRVSTGGTYISISGGVLAVSTWYHVALSVDNTSAKLFLNGVQIGSTTTFTNFTFTPIGVAVGANANGFNSSTEVFNGYIDDLRITKGVARYTANFTPPTAAFPNN